MFTVCFIYVATNCMSNTKLIVSMSSFTEVLTIHMAQDRARSSRGQALGNGQLGSTSWPSAGMLPWHILMNCNAKYKQQLFKLF